MKNQIKRTSNGDFKVIPSCSECERPATWIRSTQFAGDHPYCDEHAKEQNDFQQNDSYAYWYEVEGNK